MYLIPDKLITRNHPHIFLQDTKNLCIYVTDISALLINYLIEDNYDELQKYFPLAEEFRGLQYQERVLAVQVVIFTKE
jgi:hypothetical protein